MIRVRLSPLVRVSASMVCLMMCVLFIAAFLGLVPQRESAILQGRKELCETIAIHCSLAAQRRDFSTIRQEIQALMRRNPAIVSAVLRDGKGEILFQAGDHEFSDGDGRAPGSGGVSRPRHYTGPGHNGGPRNDGAVSIPIALEDKLWGTIELRFRPATARGIWAWLGNPMVQLSSFMALAGFPAYFIYLRKLQTHQHGRLERKNTQLRKLLQRLKHSRKEIRRRNGELKALATRDPLTACLNRRSFFAEFETHWSRARRYQHPLSCVMVDVDYFKSINDRHGHGVGDQVLQQVAERLKTAVRQGDLVCRYGGEEFCILLPHTDLVEAEEAAERFRQEIAARSCANVMVTASLGVSSMSLGAREPRQLLDQADQALYAAKRGGRNRVMRWDQLLDQQPNSAPLARPAELPPLEPETPITFHAVTALVSALAYHSLEAAEHSRRVADLCVAVARRLLPLSQCYLLEVAALLHDIGKLGVPDAVLSKSEPVTEAEWKLIRSHQQMGQEIIMAAFTSAELRNTIRCHPCWYGGNPQHPDLPKGDNIPIGARILAIADAFDSMVSERRYRKGKSPAEAFAELRRCAGAQFDPELVERFIAVASAQDQKGGSCALVVSKQTALQLGLQLEKLAHAVDARDQRTLRLMAGRIYADASEHGIDPIARVAAQLEQAASSACDWVELTQLTLQVLDLCRSTYVSYLPQPGEKDDQPRSLTGTVMEVSHD
jgi:diguanylate cyclase (GGDEF)-like protein